MVKQFLILVRAQHSDYHALCKISEWLDNENMAHFTEESLAKLPLILNEI